jgi:hypothetical protein
MVGCPIRTAFVKNCTPLKQCFLKLKNFGGIAFFISNILGSICCKMRLRTKLIYSRTKVLDTRALNLLNAVCNRAVQVASQFTIASFFSQNALTQAILNERRIEFAVEGTRWPDITRLSKDVYFAITGGGIPAKVLKANIATDGSGYNALSRPVTATGKTAPPCTDIHYIWPIPLDELNANPNIFQNPGYYKADK